MTREKWTHPEAKLEAEIATLQFHCDKLIEACKEQRHIITTLMGIADWARDHGADRGNVSEVRRHANRIVKLADLAVYNAEMPEQD